MAIQDEMRMPYSPSHPIIATAPAELVAVGRPELIWPSSCTPSQAEKIRTSATNSKTYSAGFPARCGLLK